MRTLSHSSDTSARAVHLPKVAAQTALENQLVLFDSGQARNAYFAYRQSAQQIILWGITYSTPHYPPLHAHTHTHTHSQSGQSTCLSSFHRHYLYCEPHSRWVGLGAPLCLAKPRTSRL